MSLRFASIGAGTVRIVLLTAASAFLLAAGDAPQADRVVTQAILTSDIAYSTIDTAAAADAVTTADADVVAPVEAQRAASLVALVSAMDGKAGDAVSADREMHCLANAVYFEARGEPLEGQLAVAQAILNRVASGRYADSVCGVINQPGQFSFSRARSPRSGSDWSTAQSIALIADQSMWREIAPKAMSFHAAYVSPDWRGKAKVAQIGRHIFYR